MVVAALKFCGVVMLLLRSALAVHVDSQPSLGSRSPRSWEKEAGAASIVAIANSGATARASSLVNERFCILALQTRSWPRRESVGHRMKIWWTRLYPKRSFTRMCLHHSEKPANPSDADAHRNET